MYFLTLTFIYLCFVQLQQFWQQFVQQAYECCSLRFWRVFESVRSQTVTCRDGVLSCVKSLLKESGTNVGHKFPGSTRILRERVSRTTPLHHANPSTLSLHALYVYNNMPSTFMTTCPLRSLQQTIYVHINNPSTLSLHALYVNSACPLRS